MKLSIAAKWVIIMVVLTVVPLAILGYFAVSDMQNLGNSVADDAQAMGTAAVDNATAMGNAAVQDATVMGNAAVQDATTALNDLGADLIQYRAQDISRQCDVYLHEHPGMTIEALQSDSYFRALAVQDVGVGGYTVLAKKDGGVFLFHKVSTLEGVPVTAFATQLPALVALYEQHLANPTGITGGVYDWQEPDGSIRQKYGCLCDLEEQSTYQGTPTGTLTLVYTAYFDDYAKPAVTTQNSINTSITATQNKINTSIAATQDSINTSMDETNASIDSKVSDVRTRNIVIILAIVIVVAIIAFLVGRSVTKPITQLTAVADKVSKGELDVKIDIKSKDEIGDLAGSFERMVAAVRFLSEDQEKGGK